MNKIDTSLDGLKYVGINLTEKQYEDLKMFNMLIEANENRIKYPVFNALFLLKYLGLLPSEMICDNGNNNSNGNSYEEIKESLQRKFGKIIE